MGMSHHRGNTAGMAAIGSAVSECEVTGDSYPEPIENMTGPDGLFETNRMRREFSDLAEIAR